MAQPDNFLRVSVVVFKVLAWVVAGFQVITGLILLIGGGEPVFVGGLEIPTRVVGLLDFVAAALYFFFLWLTGSLIRLLLDIRDRLPAGGSGG
jgi:hypothetical protein